MQGANFDPLNAASLASPGEVWGRGFTGARFVLREGFEEWAAEVSAVGLDTLGLIARESLEGRIGSPSLILEDYLDRYSVDAVQIGNEMDCFGSSSWPLSFREYAELWNELAPVAARRDKLLVLGGLASGDWTATYLRAVLPLLEIAPDAVAVHPYDKEVEVARGLLRAYRAASGGLALWVTEWHRPAFDVRCFSSMLEEEADYSFFFCWSDAMVEDLGLVDRRGEMKPELMWLQASLFEMGVDSMSILSRLKSLERQQGLQTEAIFRLLDGADLDGGEESVKAILWALNPALRETSWRPRVANLPKG